MTIKNTNIELLKGTDLSVKAKYTTNDEFTFTAGAKNSDASVSGDSKGRAEIGYSDYKMKAPVIDENAPTKATMGPIATEGGKLILGPKIPKQYSSFSTPVGKVEVKLEAGVDLNEFAQRVAEPARIELQKIETLNTLVNKIEVMQTKVDALRYQIQSFKPQLPPMKINFTVPSNSNSNAVYQGGSK